MTVRTLRTRLDRLEASRKNDHAPLLDSVTNAIKPPRDDSEPTPNVIDIDAELVKIDAEVGYTGIESSLE